MSTSGGMAEETKGTPVLLKGEPIPNFVPFIKLISKKPPKPKVLNERQKLALQKYSEMGADPKNKKAAGVAAGYTPGSALEAVNNVLKIKPIVDELNKAGVTDKKIAKTISEGLEATHPMSKDDKPDFNARAKFVSEANKIKDNYPAKKLEIEEKGIIVHLNTDDERAIRQFYNMRDEK
ncbi:MAG: hypothetical protein U9Q97_04750 [Acidobacteriota bacterium]|nr:hypothetical protein [Acidobacteriota bacterium]